MIPEAPEHRFSAKKNGRGAIVCTCSVGIAIIVTLIIGIHNLRVSLDIVADQVFLTREAMQNGIRDHHEIQTEQLIRSILLSPRYSDPRHLAHFEAKVYSQNGEDGVIGEVFRRIGSTNRVFVEFGSSDGTENNTVLPLTLGWSGLWIDGDAAAVARAKQRFAGRIAAGQLQVRNEFVTAENIESHFHRAAVPRQFDLLSIDIDRNDVWVWEAIRDYSPRVVVIEYNGVFPPDIDWAITYDPTKWWDRTSWTGASLRALERVGRGKGYTLVHCDLSGTNAFFVRSDLIEQNFSGPFTTQHLYEPPRTFLASRRPGPPRNPH